MVWKRAFNDWFTHFLNSRAEFCLIFRSFFGQWSFKKHDFEINWPLGKEVQNWAVKQTKRQAWPWKIGIGILILISLFVQCILMVSPWNQSFFKDALQSCTHSLYSSNETRKTQNEHLNIVCQNLNSQ